MPADAPVTATTFPLSAMRPCCPRAHGPPMRAPLTVSPVVQPRDRAASPPARAAPRRPLQRRHRVAARRCPGQAARRPLLRRHRGAARECAGKRQSAASATASRCCPGDVRPPDPVAARRRRRAARGGTRVRARWLACTGMHALEPEEAEVKAAGGVVAPRGRARSPSSTAPATTTGRCPRASSTRARAGRRPRCARSGRRPGCAARSAPSSRRSSTTTARAAPRPSATG